MDIVLALVAGFLFALGLVLQELAASAQPRESVGGGFILRLLHQPVWLLGLASQGFGFVAQAWALGIGRMVIVQPLLVSTIVFALPIARILTGRRIARIEIVGASIVTGGLALLLTVSKTEQGTAEPRCGAGWSSPGHASASRPSCSRLRAPVTRRTAPGSSAPRPASSSASPQR